MWGRVADRDSGISKGLARGHHPLLVTKDGDLRLRSLEYRQHTRRSAAQAGSVEMCASLARYLPPAPPPRLQFSGDTPGKKNDAKKSKNQSFHVHSV